MTQRFFQAFQSAARWLAVGLAIAVAAGPGAVEAATYTWDSAPGTAGITDGSGTWSTVVTNTTWWNGTSNVAWATNSSDTAVFGAGGATASPKSTITVSGSVRAGGITFGPITSGNWDITSGTIGLADGATVSFQSGWAGNATGNLSSSLVGSNITFNQTTAANFWVSGNNTLTGTTTFNGFFGVWTFSLGSGAVVVQGPSSTIDLMNSGTVSNAFTISGAGSGSRGAIRLGNQVTTASQSQVLSGSITLAGDATIRSLTTAAFLGVTGAIGESAGGAKNLTLDFQGATPQLTLRGASSYTGTTSLTGGNGTLILDGGNNRLPATTVLSVVNSGMKVVLGGTFGGAMSQTVAGLTTSQATTAIVGGASGTSTLAVALASGTNTYAGMLGGTAANENNLALTKSGAGTLSLTGTSFTYTGNTTISGGTLALGVSAAALSSSPVIRVGSAGSSGVVFDLSARSGTYTFGSNQTVAGIGTINFGTGKTVVSQGIWAPGNSIGSNAVTGNLTLSGTSQFELGTPGTSLTSTGSSDFTAVSGTLTLGGNLSLVDNANADSQGSYGAGSYRLFTAPTVSGSFASVTAPAGATTTRVGMVYTSGTGSGQGVFANVYNLASATNAQIVNLGNVRVGDTATRAVSITNTAPANATYTETLGSSGFSSTSAGYTATGSVTGIAGGSSGTGTLLVGFTTGSAGARSGSTVLSLNSEAVNLSGLGTTGAGTQTITITGTVWNYAAASIASGTSINFGTVLKGTSLSQSLSIVNTAPTTFSEKLDATFGTPTGNATTNGGSVSLLAAGGTNSSSMTVGLDSLTAGGKLGTVQVNFTSNGDGTSGLGTTSLAPQTVSLVGTVLDPATASLVGGSMSGSNWLLNLGEFQQGSGTSSTVSFGISNLNQLDGFTADLFLASFANSADSGAIFTNLTGTSSFVTLGAGGTNSFTAWMSLSTTGTFTNVYNLSFNSSKNGTSLGGTPQNVTLTVTGVIVVPEPGAVALAGVGIMAALWTLRRRACHTGRGMNEDAA